MSRGASWTGPSVWLGVMCITIAACGSSGTGPSDAAIPITGSDGAIGCLNDRRADTYAANLTKTGTSGLFTFTLAESMPAPPAKGTNTWTLKLADGAGHAVTGATFKVTPYMPDHGHGTSVVPQASP